MRTLAVGSSNVNPKVVCSTTPIFLNFANTAPTGRCTVDFLVENRLEVTERDRDRVVPGKPSPIIADSWQTAVWERCLFVLVKGPIDSSAARTRAESHWFRIHLRSTTPCPDPINDPTQAWTLPWIRTSAKEAVSTLGEPSGTRKTWKILEKFDTVSKVCTSKHVPRASAKSGSRESEVASIRFYRGNRRTEISRLR